MCRFWYTNYTSIQLGKKGRQNPQKIQIFRPLWIVTSQATFHGQNLSLNFLILKTEIEEKMILKEGRKEGQKLKTFLL